MNRLTTVHISPGLKMYEAACLDACRCETRDADGHPEHEEVKVVDDERGPTHVLSQNGQLVCEVKPDHLQRFPARSSTIKLCRHL